jgi:Zn-dependent protease with chaperone function
METVMWWLFWVLTTLSILRLQPWRAYDGSIRFGGAIFLALLGVAALLFMEWGSYVAGVLALLSFFVLGPSPTARNARRIDRLVQRLGQELGLELVPGIIPPEELMEGLRAHGFKGELESEEVINAFAAMQDDKHVVMLTPGAACLADDELGFIIAHEIAHHALGHTRRGFAARVWDFMQSPVGLVIGGISTVLGGAPIWAAAVGGLFLKVFGRQLSQDNENAADAWAVERLRTLGMTASGGATLMRRLEAPGQGGHLLEAVNAVFGTHPSPGKRARRIRELIGREETESNRC